MINYDTIISNFDDKVTLYNWLRKVEEALKNASATNFVVNKKGNATLSFSITFADGETLESGDIVLQQGESVDDARIASGILQLHLTNGTWLTAGNIKPVSNFSIDENQHLIVNYQDGTSQDLGAIFNGNVVIDGNLSITGELSGTNIKRYIDGNFNPAWLNGCTLVNSFIKAFLNCGELQFIANFRIANETENAITIGSDGQFAGYPIPAKYKKLIYAHNGNNCEQGAQGSIAYCALFISNTSGTYDAELTGKRFANLYHSGDLFLFNEGGAIVVPAGKTFDFEARISLAV